MLKPSRSARGGITTLTPRERPHERTEPKERERDARRVEKKQQLIADERGLSRHREVSTHLFGSISCGSSSSRSRSSGGPCNHCSTLVLTHKGTQRASHVESSLIHPTHAPLNSVPRRQKLPTLHVPVFPPGKQQRHARVPRLGRYPVDRTERSLRRVQVPRRLGSVLQPQQLIAGVHESTGEAGERVHVRDDGAGGRARRVSRVLRKSLKTKSL